MFCLEFLFFRLLWAQCEFDGAGLVVFNSHSVRLGKGPTTLKKKRKLQALRGGSTAFYTVCRMTHSATGYLICCLDIGRYQNHIQLICTFKGSLTLITQFQPAETFTAQF